MLGEVISERTLLEALRRPSNPEQRFEDGGLGSAPGAGHALSHAWVRVMHQSLAWISAMQVQTANGPESWIESHELIVVM